MNNDGRRDTNVSVKCLCCGKDVVVNVWAKDLAAWKAGEYAQVAFPYLRAGQRELLISKTCEECFDKMFKEDDDGEVEEG